MTAHDAGRAESALHVSWHAVKKMPSKGFQIYQSIYALRSMLGQITGQCELGVNIISSGQSLGKDFRLYMKRALKNGRLLADNNCRLRRAHCLASFCNDPYNVDFDA